MNKQEVNVILSGIEREIEEIKEIKLINKTKG